MVSRHYLQGMEQASAFIPAATGGSVTLGTATLSIPPGALEEDTTITMGCPEGAPDVGERGLAHWELGPTGLVFDSAATLRLEYQEPAKFHEELLNGHSFDEGTGTWQRLDVLAHDTDRNVRISRRPLFPKARLV
jgi:hypothetical protein